MSVRILIGDVRERLRELPDESVHCVVTSPPYWGLRDYGVPGQLGLEATPEEHVRVMVDVFREVRRVMRKDATLWLNYGSLYASSSTQPSQHCRDLSEDECGSGGRGLRDSSARDSACSHLCDECRDASLSRNVHSSQPRGECEQRFESAGQRMDASDQGPEEIRSSPSAALASTTTGSSARLLGECSHCANCGVCLRVARSATRDGSLCARRDSYLYTDDTSERLLTSLRRIAGNDPSSLAWLYSTIAFQRLKAKDLINMPAILAEALRVDGWYLRSDIIWAKPSPMPESVTDRPTKSHEHLFLLAKSPTYYYDQNAVREKTGGEASWEEYEKADGHTAPHGDLATGVNGGFGSKKTSLTHPAGRNLRDVWTIPTEPFPGAHFAVFPQALVVPCIKAGTSEHGCCSKCGAPWVRITERVSTGKSYATGKSAVKRAAGLHTNFSGYDDGSSCPVFKTTGWSPGCDCAAPVVPCTVLDPFGGSGTVGLVADKLGRNGIGIELNPEYAAMAERRIRDDCPLFAEVEVC